MAERDFEELLKNVTQINARLEITGRLLNDLTQKLASVGANSPLAGMVKSLESDIRRLTELRNKTSFEAVTKATTPQTLSPAQDAARQTVLREAERSLENYKRELDAAVARIHARINQPISPGLRNAADRYIYGGNAVYPQPLPDRASRARQIFPEAYGIQSGAVTNIPHPQKNIVEDAEKRYAEWLNRKVREGERVEYFNGPNASVARLRDQFEKGLSSKQYDLTGFGVDKVSEAERLQQEALNSVRYRIQTEKRYASVLEAAAKQGYSIDDLTFARSRGTAGTQEFRFRKYDSNGVQQQLDLFNTAGGRTTAGISNQFRTFGQGVVRDIGELTKWSIALAAVYGPMRKLQELTQIMIENQTKLAEATISVSSSFLDQEDIFNLVSDSAEKAGESISTTIDAFTQAYRATGGTGDQVERLATAQNLLNDSLTLSKLSTLDQASAIDTLSAALRQSNGDLNGGTDLLDKWVRVTKVANVDLASLATGFAVLGDAAESAGLSTDDLNGVLATIAETGVASGRELANTARAIVAGFQSDQAVEALERFGIATKDSEGNLRSFLDISREINDLYKNGIISKSALSGLGLDIGGGSRRGAAVTTFLKNVDRAFAVSKESSRAAGDAQAALARQLETVQTSLTRLGNSFQELAQTLGTEGGFLGIITSGVDGVTAMVKAFDSLTSILGKATPALAAFIATSLILKQRGQGGIQQALFGFGQGQNYDELQGRLYAASQGQSAFNPTAGQRAGRFLATNVFGTNASSGAIQGLLAASIPAILNATNKEDRFGGTKAVGDVVGGIIGGVVGALGGPQGALIGATIGVSIAEAFVNSTIARRTNIFAYGKTPTIGDKLGGGNTQEDLDNALREAEINLYKSIGRGNESLGRFFSAPTRTDQVVVDRLNQAIKEGNKEQFEQRLKATQSELKNLGITPELARKAFEDRQEISVTQENRAYRLASEDARRAYDQALAARVAKGGTTEDATTAFSKLVDQNENAFRNLIASQREQSKEQLSQSRISGDVRGAEYGRRTAALSGYDVKALQYYTALGDRVKDLTGGTEDAQRAFEILNNVIVKGPEDSLPQMTALVGEISEIINLLDNPALNEERLADLGGISAAQEKLDIARETLANLLEDANNAALLSGLKIPNLQGDINKPLTQDEFGLVKQQASQLQDEFYQGFLKIPDDMYSALKDSWDEWAQIVEKSGDIFYEKVTDIDPQFFQQAMQKLIQDNKLKSQQTNPFDIQKLDISSKQGAGLQGSIDYFSRYLTQNFPQYQQKPEQFGVIFNDYVTSVLHGDNLAVKLALEKLVDINQKQLDGMYNIPEGATFWVPLTAAYYRPKNEGGLPGAGGQFGSDNTSALKENTNALRELSYAFKGDLGYAPRTTEPQRLPHEDRYDKMNTMPARLPHEDRYDKMNTFTRTTSGQATGESFIQQLLNALRDIFRGVGNEFPGRQGPRPGGFGDAGGGYRGGFAAQSSAQQVAPAVNARIDMRIDNSTQLVVDGRVLASVVTPYLSNDLVRLEAAQGTITKRYII